MPDRSTESRDDLLRLAVDMAPAGLLAVDERGCILLVNREVERPFGWKREERPVLGEKGLRAALAKPCRRDERLLASGDAAP